jgi:hypothetical protein
LAVIGAGIATLTLGTVIAGFPCLDDLITASGGSWVLNGAIGGATIVVLVVTVITFLQIRNRIGSRWGEDDIGDPVGGIGITMDRVEDSISAESDLTVGETVVCVRGIIILAMFAAAIIDDAVIASRNKGIGVGTKGYQPE